MGTLASILKRHSTLRQLLEMIYVPSQGTDLNKASRITTISQRRAKGIFLVSSYWQSNCPLLNLGWLLNVSQQARSLETFNANARYRSWSCSCYERLALICHSKFAKRMYLKANSHNVQWIDWYLTCAWVRGFRLPCNMHAEEALLTFWDLGQIPWPLVRCCRPSACESEGQKRRLDKGGATEDCPEKLWHSCDPKGKGKGEGEGAKGKRRG